MTDPAPTSTTKGAALVTGASDRVGAAIAERLAAEGYPVVVHYRSSAQAAAAVSDRILAEGGRATIAYADLAVRSDRAGLVAEAAAAFGPLAVLVNNASLYEPDAATDIDEALWDSHFAVHAEAPVFLTRDFAAQLPPEVSGNVINIIDERVLRPSPAYLSYSLSKSVLWTATQTLAQSLAPNIRVNAIGPGPVLPHMKQTQEEFEAAVSTLPLQRHADPQAIADAVLFLISAYAVTGQMLALDGGRHLEYPPRRGPTPRQ
jgi:NAD(P)-dependent dehydrogenase (short-subunit alcohol dehydrogenase family)